MAIARHRAPARHVELTVEESRLQVNRSAVVVLLFGGAGGLIVALWPFFPGLMPLLPVAVVLALAGLAPGRRTLAHL